MIRVLYEVAFAMSFNLLCDRGQQAGVLKLMKNSHFLVFSAIWVLLPKFFGRWRVNYIKITWNDKSAICSFVWNEFQFPLWSRSAGRSTQTYKKWSFFSAFSRLGPFPQAFAQVKEWLILELHGVIRLLYLVACPVDFNLISDGGQQSGVLKPTKNEHFQIFLAVRVSFLKFLGRLRSVIFWSWIKW